MLKKSGSAILLEGSPIAAALAKPLAKLAKESSTLSRKLGKFNFVPKSGPLAKGSSLRAHVLAKGSSKRVP